MGIDVLPQAAEAIGAVSLPISHDDVHETTPTAAQCAAALTANAVNGTLVLADDNGATVSYLIWKSGGAYFFAAGTKAT